MLDRRSMFARLIAVLVLAAVPVTFVGCRSNLVGADWVPAAEVSIPSVFADHMVLQREMPITVWGWATAGGKVTVALGRNEVVTRANSQGEWKVALPEMKAGGPHKMTISGKNTLTLTDILVGEVWIGSGQSNMQWSVAGAANGGAESAVAKYPKIRLFLVPNVLSGTPKRDVKAKWTACNPATVKPFSAVLYYFGRELHKELDVPVGLIASSWGGSRIEPWVPPVGFASVKELKDLSETVRTAPKANLAGYGSPTAMYNAMIHPLVPFGVRGAIWYQGESNLFDGMLYAHKKRALVEGWRKVWGNDKLSFYWVQLAPYVYNAPPEFLARIWEAQAAAMSIPRTGMAVITDIGHTRDIHPRNKQDVGKRLALWALAKDYDRDIVYSGPIYKSMKIEGNKIRVSFDHTGTGLKSRDGKPLNWFQISDGPEFVDAKAVIDGKTVVVWSDAVAKPEAVRFAWHQLAEPNLQNSAGLQACTFRTISTTPTISGRKVFVRPSVVTIACVEMGGTIRYTVDGSEPTARSRKYTKPILIKKTTTVRARFFRENGAKSFVAQASFERVKPLSYKGMMLVPGVHYEYYEGSWVALPDFSQLKPVKSGTTGAFSLEPRKRGDHFGFRFTGYIFIKAAGKYTFETASDDGSQLFVDGKMIVDNNGSHPVIQKTGSVELKPGMHKIVVTFFEGAGGEHLAVKYQGPDLPMQPLPAWCEE